MLTQHPNGEAEIGRKLYRLLHGASGQRFENRFDAHFTALLVSDFIETCSQRACE